MVPVNPDTVDEWTHPPFSGHFDGERIWGRGSSDDKSGLIGIMSTIESLLERNFQPTRGVVLAFGFDEEVSGLHVRIHCFPCKSHDSRVRIGRVVHQQVSREDIRRKCVPYARR